MTIEPALNTSRRDFHKALLGTILYTNARGVPSISDKDSKPSMRIGTKLLEILGAETADRHTPGQLKGETFERITKTYVETAFEMLKHLRPGSWQLQQGEGSHLAIASFVQYAHLSDLEELARKNTDLATALGSDYLIKPDIVIARLPESEKAVNQYDRIADETIARLTDLRALNQDLPLLHACISCKWTIRSDRAQNARSEALNLVRNRKGHLPHIAALTAEPASGRLASLALGTGDIDYVYHIALPELQESYKSCGLEDGLELIDTMVEGNRLRDIADLPFDLIA